MINERVMPVVAGIDIRYLHQLKYGQQYVVHSRVSGWNEKWFYISQSISTKDTGKLAVTSMVRAAFLQKGKVLNPYDLMVRLGYEDSGSQKMPDYVAVRIHDECSKLNLLSSEIRRGRDEPPSPPQAVHAQGRRRCQSWQIDFFYIARLYNSKKRQSISSHLIRKIIRRRRRPRLDRFRSARFQSTRSRCTRR